MGPIGPDAGGIYRGMTQGRIRNLEAENDALVAELNDTRARLMRALAAKEGFKTVASGMVAELRQEAAGQLASRRLTDANNRPARIQLLEDAEEDELRRLSGGRLSVTRTTPRGR